MIKLLLMQSQLALHSATKVNMQKEMATVIRHNRRKDYVSNEEKSNELSASMSRNRIIS